jgi:hypothetical protein
MKKIVIMPGGFHPFHAGHAALYQSAVKAFPDADVYVAASNDTSERPFPFAIKEKLARVAGVPPGRFVQVKSPFTSEEITSKYDPNSTVLIFVKSQKNAKNGADPEGPFPAEVDPSTGKLPLVTRGPRKGQPVSDRLQYYKGNEKNLQPMSQHSYLAYLPTVKFGPGITSASEIRNAWPKLDDRRKTAMVMSLYPATQKNPKLAQNVVQLLDVGMGGAEGVAEGSLNEFAVDGFGDSGDHRSKLLASVGRLFDAGNKVDWQVPGQMGHVTRVQDDGVTMKKWKTPHSRMSFFLPMRDDSRDKQYTIKMVAPKHYAVVSAEQGVAESYSNTTFQTERRRLNVPALIKAGALFVTYPHGEQGWETDNQEDWAYSLISLYNVMQGGWPGEAKKYLKPASYKKAEQQINSSAPNLGSDKLVYDGKYNQILWSIKKLGIPDSVAFLDNGKQGVAEASYMSLDDYKNNLQNALPSIIEYYQDELGFIPSKEQLASAVKAAHATMERTGDTEQAGESLEAVLDSFVPSNSSNKNSQKIDFKKNLLQVLQQKYPDAEFKIGPDRVESTDGQLSVIADTEQEGKYVGCFMWDVSTGPYKGALGIAIKKTTDQLLQANPGKKPALFISGDNQNPEAWSYIAKKLKYKLITDDNELEEGNDDDIWGPQGNFAGDRPVNIGGVTVNKLQVGDIVTYFGQKAKIEAMSKTGNTSRITIANKMGGITQDVLTRDLKRTGMSEEIGRAGGGFGTNYPGTYEEENGPFTHKGGLKLTSLTTESVDYLDEK